MSSSRMSCGIGVGEVGVFVGVTWGTRVAVGGGGTFSFCTLRSGAVGPFSFGTLRSGAVGFPGECNILEQFSEVA